MAWMPAVADGVFYLGIGVLVALASKSAPGLLTGPRIVGLIALLAGMASLRAFDNHRSILTVDLLALGVAVRAARWAGPQGTDPRRLAGDDRPCSDRHDHGCRAGPLPPYGAPGAVASPGQDANVLL
jgi:hypothetical protein